MLFNIAMLFYFKWNRWIKDCTLLTWRGRWSFTSKR